MAKALIIAEKPSVAADIAKALGGFKKLDEYFESDTYVLSSAVGHLVELCLPNELDKKKGKWSFANLPIIPDEFSLKPIEKSEPRLRVLKKLLKRDDVENLINACDAGREGELIFRYIVKLCGSKKPIQRLWLQSMTPAAIRDGFTKLRPGSELEPLAQAAVCRSESDWLVGINGTRALTAFNSKGGGFQLTTVGRVQTPTLAILVDRERKIRDFISKDYFELHGTFGAQAGDYPGRWFDEAFKKPEGEEDSDKKAERIWDKTKAETIQTKCLGKPGIVTEDKKPTTQLSPLLYDLTSLQREGNSRFGLPARRTLQIAQSLYERHKVLTYPRTDSRYLPEDYLATVRNTLGVIGDGPLGKFANQILKEGWLKPTKRVFNNAKVSDHFAIIPTLQTSDKLDEMELKIYEMVVKRFLAVFFPAAEFEVTTRITRVEGEAFRSDGKILKVPGWLAIYGREEQGEDDAANLIAVQEGETVQTKDVELKSLITKPPARFNEATLLSAMEGAGKLIDDEDLRDAMAAKGLGTPATRAAIIEGLILEKYVERQGRDLAATPKALSLMELLHVLKIDSLTSPEMTGGWEHKLKQMEAGAYTRSRFMSEISELTQQIVHAAKTFEESGHEAKPTDLKSPDGSAMVETLRHFQTPDGAFKVSRVIAGRLMEPIEVQELITKRFVGPLSGFKSRLGRPFAAALKMDDAAKVEFVFDNAPVGASGEKLDITTQEPLGVCPIDGGKVYETLMSCACENSFKETPTCTFKIGKKILSKEITKEMVVKLLTEKKTDLIPGFVSMRTRRPFSAFLKLGNDGKVSFEFPERTGPAKGGKPSRFAKKKAS